MATVKRITDLRDYTSVLPYASELFGVYQPLLGWKSKRIAQRFSSAHDNDKQYVLAKLIRQFTPIIGVVFTGPEQAGITLKPGVLAGGKRRSFDSRLLELISTGLPAFEKLDPTVVWAKTITVPLVSALLSKDVAGFYAQQYADLRKGDAAGGLDAALRARALDPPAAPDFKNGQ